MIESALRLATVFSSSDDDIDDHVHAARRVHSGKTNGSCGGSPRAAAHAALRKEIYDARSKVNHTYSSLMPELAPQLPDATNSTGDAHHRSRRPAPFPRSPAVGATPPKAPAAPRAPRSDVSHSATPGRRGMVSPQSFPCDRSCVTPVTTSASVPTLGHSKGGAEKPFAPVLESADHQRARLVDQEVRDWQRFTREVAGFESLNVWAHAALDAVDENSVEGGGGGERLIVVASTVLDTIMSARCEDARLWQRLRRHIFKSVFASFDDTEVFDVVRPPRTAAASAQRTTPLQCAKLTGYESWASKWRGAQGRIAELEQQLAGRHAALRKFAHFFDAATDGWQNDLACKCLRVWAWHTKEQQQRRARFTSYAVRTTRTKQLMQSFGAWRAVTTSVRAHRCARQSDAYRAEAERAMETLQQAVNEGKEAAMRELTKTKTTLEEERDFRERQFTAFTFELESVTKNLERTQQHLDNTDAESRLWRGLWKDVTRTSMPRMPAVVSPIMLADAQEMMQQLTLLLALHGPDAAAIVANEQLGRGSESRTRSSVISGTSALLFSSDEGSQQLHNEDPSDAAAHIEEEDAGSSRASSCSHRIGETTASRGTARSGASASGASTLIPTGGSAPRASLKQVQHARWHCIRSIRQQLDKLVVNWVNHVLTELGVGRVVVNMEEDLADGEVYLVLCAVITRGEVAGANHRHQQAGDTMKSSKANLVTAAATLHRTLRSVPNLLANTFPIAPPLLAFCNYAQEQLREENVLFPRSGREEWCSWLLSTFFTTFAIQQAALAEGADSVGMRHHPELQLDAASWQMLGDMQVVERPARTVGSPGGSGSGGTSGGCGGGGLAVRRKSVALRRSIFFSPPTGSLDPATRDLADAHGSSTSTSQAASSPRKRTPRRGPQSSGKERKVSPTKRAAQGAPPSPTTPHKTAALATPQQGVARTPAIVGGAAIPKRTNSFRPGKQPHFRKSVAFADEHSGVAEPHIGGDPLLLAHPRGARAPVRSPLVSGFGLSSSPNAGSLPTELLMLDSSLGSAGRGAQGTAAATAGRGAGGALSVCPALPRMSFGVLSDSTEDEGEDDAEGEEEGEECGLAPDQGAHIGSLSGSLSRSGAFLDVVSQASQSASATCRPNGDWPRSVSSASTSTPPPSHRTTPAAEQTEPSPTKRAERQPGKARVAHSVFERELAQVRELVCESDEVMRQKALYDEFSSRRWTWLHIARLISAAVTCVGCLHKRPKPGAARRRKSVQSTEAPSAGAGVAVSHDGDDGTAAKTGESPAGAMFGHAEGDGPNTPAKEAETGASDNTLEDLAASSSAGILMPVSLS